MVVADHACLACSAWGQALLTGGCLRGVAREILTEFAGELGKTGANIAIQRLDHVGNLLAVDGLVMRIGTGPEGRTAFRIEQLQIIQYRNHLFVYEKKKYFLCFTRTTKKKLLFFFI